MTKFAEAIQPTLDWLKAGAPVTTIGDTEKVSFNMNWFKHWDSCGTSCCIAGHVVLIHEEREDYRPEELEAQNILGLTFKEAHVLFYAEAFGKALCHITPEEAVKTIEHFIATGRMDWVEANQ